LNEVLSWAGEQLEEDSAIWRAFAEGIGHPGQYFLVRMELQIGFIVDFARRLKEQPVERRREILADPWQLRDFMDAGAEEETTPGMRHVLLHLLQPTTSSGSRAARTAAARAGRLLRAAARGTWGAGRAGDGTDPLDALELQKQLVIFGPPGTSKTYEAKQLAKQIIRRAAMCQWGPVVSFERQEELEQVVQSHVRRLQLHPAYSYEEFIRGLRLREGKTVYEDGYLLRLVEEINKETAASDQQRFRGCSSSTS
jgi:5-methylcytosine-specific restriction enzyme B